MIESRLTCQQAASVALDPWPDLMREYLDAIRVLMGLTQMSFSPADPPEVWMARLTAEYEAYGLPELNVLSRAALRLKVDATLLHLAAAPSTVSAEKVHDFEGTLAEIKEDASRVIDH